jgi:hypothetical protein
MPCARMWSSELKRPAPKPKPGAESSWKAEPRDVRNDLGITPEALLCHPASKLIREPVTVHK